MNRFYVVAGFLIMIVLGMSGCQKEKTSIPSYLQMPELTGKWYLHTLYITTSTDNSVTSHTDSATSFTAQDYFEFKADNAATFSSTIFGKSYEGYYSANSSVAPATLTFKSVDFLNKYNISKVTKDSLVLYQTQATKVAGVTTTVANYYVYKH